MDYVINNKITYYNFNDAKKNELIKRLREYFTHDDRIRLAFIFGSFIRRYVVRDLDIAIFADPPLAFNEYLKLGVMLELEVGLPIDVVQVHELSPYFRLKIIDEGLPLVIKSHSLISDIVAQTRTEIVDLEISLKIAKNASAKT